MKLVLAAAAVVVVSAVSAFTLGDRTVTHTTAGPGRTVTMYLQNFDPAYVSDQRIRADIPVWEAAANGAFRRTWNTPRIRLVLLTKDAAPPRDAPVADFASTGPVQGAAAYHTENRGRPAIVVYAGVDDMYGVSLSVAFTHELFEYLADPFTAQINQGWPYPYITISHGQFGEPAEVGMPEGQLPINEVCDPVEDSHYVLRDGLGRAVWISDWVTPNWFNDEKHSQAADYDYLGLVQQPFTILPGGYMSIFVLDYVLPNGGMYSGWLSVTNFRTAADRAFFHGEKHGHVLNYG